MKTVYARDTEGQERLLALVRRDGGIVYVCPIDKYNQADEEASLEFAIGFPVNDIREESTAS